MSTPFFSIIIPTYNSELILNETLDSILSQQFEDFEILIMDGLSTDGTLSIAQSKKDNRIRIYSEKDKNIFDAMNKGLKLSSGEWIYFIGSDDTFFDNEVLGKVNKEILAEEVDIIYGNIMSKRFGGVYDGEFSAEKLYHQNICHQAIFIKKDVFNRTGEFDIKYPYNADWDNNFKWFFNHKVEKKFVDLIVANYADGGKSSLARDVNFDNDKPFKYLKYSGKELSNVFKRNIYITIAIQQKQSKKYFSFIITKIKLLILDLL